MFEAQDLQYRVDGDECIKCVLSYKSQTLKKNIVVCVKCMKSNIFIK